MPKSKRPVRAMTLSRNEQRFIGRYVKEGATEEKIRDCERRAKLKPGEGARMLKRAHVQEEIQRRLEPVRFEQERQRLVADAVDEVLRRLSDKTAEQEAQIRVLADIPMMRVEVPKLEHELMRLAVGLDPEKHPQVKLAAIQAAFIVSGTLENGNIRRVVPLEKGAEDFGGAMYGDLYDRMHEIREKGANPAGPKLLEAEVEVHDLMPHAAPTGPDLPPPGEEIENPAAIETPAPQPAGRQAKAKAAREGFTVEIG